MSVSYFYDLISTNEQIVGGGMCVVKASLLNLNPLGASGSLGDPMWRGRGRPPLAGHLPPPALGQKRAVLVLDAEHCLDRLYGGCFPDWTCGGQWRNMVSFLTTILATMHRANVEFVVFFNGAIEASRFADWKADQAEVKARVRQVLNHVNKRGTPPPKAYWLPPCGLRTMLRLALRSLNIPVIHSVEDHRLEMAHFCWERGCQGILSDDAELALFMPPRFFSAHSLKLTAMHDLKASEYVIDEIAKFLDLNPIRFCLLGALLGNHILTKSDLETFHNKFLHSEKQDSKPHELLIRGVLTYIRALPNMEDYDRICTDLFGSPKDPRGMKLRDAVRYFQSGTYEGFLKMRQTNPQKRSFVENLKSSIEEACLSSAVQKEKPDRHKKRSANSKKDSACAVNLVERIALNLEELDLNQVSNGDCCEDQQLKKGNESSVTEKKTTSKPLPPLINIPEPNAEVRRISVERHRQGQMSAYILQLLQRGEIKLPVLLEDFSNPEFLHIHRLYQPLRQTVYAILYNLHHLAFSRRQLEEKQRPMKKKLADLKKLEKNIDLSDEERKKIQSKIDEATSEYESCKVPLRPDYCVREWMPYNNYTEPEIVKPVELRWGVPTVYRLWFSTAPEDKDKRLRAFLTCMRCDDVQSLMVPANVPQQTIILACVLRYIMSSTKMPLLMKPELDAFLVTAFSPELGNLQYLSELTLDRVTTRGIQLATLFMEGVEMAILANDACGAPIPFEITLPSFFDGKLFHQKLQRAGCVRNLLELCDARIDIAAQIERLRAVILNGIQPFQFLPFNGNMSLHGGHASLLSNHALMPVPNISKWDQNRGHQMRPRRADGKHLLNKHLKQRQVNKASEKSKSLGSNVRNSQVNCALLEDVVGS